jgi:hypothetical protein
MQIFGYKQS